MPIKRGQAKGKYYYQFGDSGKKYFYIVGNKRSRTIAKHKAEKQQKAMYANQSGGAAFRFNTQTPERVEELKVKYAGKAHPSFVEQYADILNDRPRMMGWRGSVPSNLWYPEEHAAYLRDGSPKSKEDITRIMGTVGNERQYGDGMRPISRWPLPPRPKRGQYGKNAVQ